MKTVDSRADADLVVLIEKGADFHGHLGPFLVIGVRMGMIAKRALGIGPKQQTELRANVKIPLYPPFSCILDGIQVTTTCTVGNQRLIIEDSEEMCVTFSRRDSNRMVKITFEPRLAEELKEKLSEDALTEEFALKIAGLPENQVFNIALE